MSHGRFRLYGSNGPTMILTADTRLRFAGMIHHLFHRRKSEVRACFPCAGKRRSRHGDGESQYMEINMADSGSFQPDQRVLPTPIRSELMQSQVSCRLREPARKLIEPRCLQEVLP